LLVCRPLIVIAYTVADELISEPAYVKGYVGERLMDDFYAASGRKEILGKMGPTQTGPDRIFQLRNGTIEVHEVKLHEDWPGAKALTTEVESTKVDQLSDEWLDSWMRRVRGNPLAGPEELRAANEVEKARRVGKLTRVYDEIKASSGHFRSSVALPKGTTEVQLRDLQGPLRLERYLSKSTSIRKELNKAPRLNQQLMVDPKLGRIRGHLHKFEDFQRCGRISGTHGECIRPGLMLPDGRLIVSYREGATAAILVFTVEAGAATYEYVSGNCFAPEYERRVADAAVKGLAVVGATAVAVFLGVAPGGFVVLGIGVGTYILSETLLQKWHESQDRKFLTRDDLAVFGIQLQSPLEFRTASPLDIRPRGPLDIRPVSPLDVKPVGPF